MKKLLILAFYLSAAASWAFGANCPDTTNNAAYVLAGAGGSHTGADWTNPYAALPATLTRGCTYYVAGGTYSAYTANTAASATTLITIQAATLASHGTATGWSTSYATDVSGPGTNQAVFPHPFTFTTGYWVLSGGGTYAGMGCGSTDATGYGAGGAGCGIKITGASGAYDLVLCSGLSTCPTHLTVSYVDIAGSGLSGTDAYEAGVQDDSNGGTSSNGGGGNFTLSHMYIHQVHGGPVFTERANTITLDHSYIIGNASSSTYHAEGWADMDTQNVTISYNDWVSIEGSGYIVELDRGGCQGTCTVNNWQIYGNLFWYDNGNHLSCQSGSCNTGIGDGAIACINALICTNWVIYENVFVNGYGYEIGLCEDCTAEGNVHSSWTVKNNLWWNNTRSATTLTVAGGGGGCSSCTMTEDYNSALGYVSGSLTGFTGAHDIKVQSTPASPFVGWSSSPANFNLASDGSNWNTRASLGSPYDTDAAGNTFTTDRGAYQFLSLSTLNPPTGLIATVN